ncbi:DJ-1/PfpI family protein [Paenibacillus sp. V4I5]|uniref:DJ-1/PfpI family protein n=1 Tax=Paenibacillus sp. V4I5 TaxID=3042306 RepID=UPI00279122E4|nr:DJ-1/PfpI family protein [Paenibacillus sp. V4I5]MDQ0921126.1 transcriptional regulator GlxA family with amidase domain [Paenibacillus sp. V4I5]
MKMAFVLFDGMTTLDFAGFFEAITWMGILGANENVTWDFCSNKEEITDDRGLTVKARHVYPDLSGYDLLFVPGGFSTRSLRFDSAFITWLQTSAKVTYKASVCTGALLLGAAGFLHEKKATTNPSAYDLLTPYCSEVVKKRIVRDGNLFTGGGVSASIDLGLFVIESLTDSHFVQQVQQKMDYPYYQAGQLSNVNLE